MSVLPTENNMLHYPTAYNKYANKKTAVYGMTFDSKKESQHYLLLRDLEKKKEISQLVLQPKFILLSPFTDRQGKRYQGIIYIADFSYIDKHGKQHVEDVKGYRTKEYLLKKKLFLAKYRYYYFTEV